MKAEQPLVSVIVPCRNEAAHVRRFLDCVLAQETGPWEWEVIVADGMSDDGTREILDEYARRNRRIRVIDNPGKIVSTALNKAIRAARGEIIVRMDVHARYAPDFLRQSVAVLEETGADNVGGPWLAEAESYLGRVIAAAFQSPYVAGGARSRRHSYEGPVDTVYLGCWRKSTLLRLGLFDELLVRNQDDELNLRIVRSGGVVWQSPRIRSWYRPRESLRALFLQYFQYGFWKVAVIRKHKLPASWRHLVPGLFVLANASLLLLWALAAAAGSEGAALFSARAWAAQAAAYVLAALWASLWAARRKWSLLPVLPFVFATYHVSYGLGFLAGLGHFMFGSKRRQPGELFTALSR